MGINREFKKRKKNHVRMDSQRSLVTCFTAIKSVIFFEIKIYLYPFTPSTLVFLPIIKYQALNSQKNL